MNSEFPLPRVDDTLDLLSGARYITTLDLASAGGNGGNVTKKDCICHSYEFRKIPFGLVNAPATFQRLMEIVLSGVARNGCHVYLDDVLEPSRNTTVISDESLIGSGKPAPTTAKEMSLPNCQWNICATWCQRRASKRAQRRWWHWNPTGPMSFIVFASYYRRFVPKSQVPFMP